MESTSNSNSNPSPPLEIPTPATGLRRRWNQGVLVAMHMLPGPMRRWLGWWRWGEVMEGQDYANALWVDGDDRPDRLPAAKLWRRGIMPSSRKASRGLWPRAFKSLADREKSDSEWHKVPDSEIVAWVGMWKNHPHGGECLNKALLGLIHKGEVERVRLLVSVGAGQEEGSDLPSALHEALWGRICPISEILDVWRVLHKAGLPIQSWDEWADEAPGRITHRWTAKDMECWRKSGLPLPTGKGAFRHAWSWVKDPPIALAFPDSTLRNGWTSQKEDDEIGVAIEAIRWFRENGNLPPEANTELLKTWLSTARPGGNERHQYAVRLWLDELLSDGLPPRPGVGPRWKHLVGVLDDGPQPWSHWWAKCPFFENIPQAHLEKIFDEPDAWSAVNQDGEDVRDIIERRVKDTRGQQRDRELEKVMSWVLASTMQTEIPDVIETTNPQSFRIKSRF